MADTLSAAATAPPVIGSAGVQVSATSTVGGAQVAAGAGATIPARLFEAWLVALSPAQLRSVLASAVADGALASLPAAFQSRALDLAPHAARLAATAELDAYAAGVALPLVRLPDGSLFYSAGGEQYRLVPDAATADSLGLTLSAAVPVDTLELPQAAPWPHMAPPAVAFEQAGAIIAGRGSTAAAHSFAVTWRGRVA